MKQRIIAIIYHYQEHKNVQFFFIIQRLYSYIYVYIYVYKYVHEVNDILGIFLLYTLSLEFSKTQKKKKKSWHVIIFH